MIETLAVIDAPPTPKYPSGFYAGIVLWDDVVVEAADICKYMRRGRWDRARVRDYCRARGWAVSVVHQLERSTSIPRPAVNDRENGRSAVNDKGPV